MAAPCRIDPIVRSGSIPDLGAWMKFALPQETDIMEREGEVRKGGHSRKWPVHETGWAFLASMPAEEHESGLVLSDGVLLPA